MNVVLMTARRLMVGGSTTDHRKYAKLSRRDPCVGQIIDVLRKHITRGSLRLQDVWKRGSAFSVCGEGHRHNASSARHEKPVARDTSQRVLTLAKCVRDLVPRLYLG